MLTSPLLFAAGTFWAALGSLKTRDNTSRRKLPREECVEGGVLPVLWLLAAFRSHVAGKRRCYLLRVMMNWRHQPPLSPARSRWRWLSARWRWAQTVGCQAWVDGWQRLGSGGLGEDCVQRRSPRCPVDGRWAAGAHAKPPGLEGRRSSTQGWRQQKQAKSKHWQRFK